MDSVKNNEKGIISKSISSTREFAGKILNKILKSEISKPHKHALIFALEGELGAGKTTFIKALANALGIKQNITSPTFILMKQYNIPQAKQDIPFRRLVHIDAYRIKNDEQTSIVGIQEILDNPQNIVCIEWADKIPNTIPSHSIWLRFKHKNLNTRIISSNVK